jgi:fluoride ion exporter CrcB/FEX
LAHTASSRELIRLRRTGAGAVVWQTRSALHRWVVDLPLLQCTAMTVAVAVLLISVLSTTGLLALWAANSRRHWFVRTAAFLAVLSPILLVPINELYVALAAQGAVVAGAIPAERRQSLISSRNSPTVPQRLGFSVSTLLLATVIFGIAASAASGVPRTMNRQAWQSLALVGFCGGAATLLGYRAAKQRGWRRKTAALAAAVVAAAVLALAPAWFDWMAHAIAGHSEWPPAEFNLNSTLQPATRPLVSWFIALPALSAATFLLVLLASIAFGASAPTTAKRRLAAFAVALLGAAFAAPSLYVLYCLLTPNPKPIVSLPEPNGYDYLVAAGRMAENSLVNGGIDPQAATEQQLAPAVSQVAAALQRGREGLSKEVQARVSYTYGPNGFAELQLVRALARGYYAEGYLARQQGDSERASASFMDAIQVGIASRRGGLWVHGLVGVATTGMGAAGMFHSQGDLSAAQCQLALVELQKLLDECEPFESLEARDKLWMQHAYGWYVHVYHILDVASGEYDARNLDSAFVREAAILRLLMANLALRAYRAEHGKWPETWNQVEAAGLGGLPQDPYEPRGASLRYRREGDSFQLYSVGPNGLDEQGKAPPRDNMGTYHSPGDFQLEAWYGPAPTAPAVDEIDGEQDEANGDKTPLDDIKSLGGQSSRVEK